MMLKCFHTVQLTSTIKSKNSHIYVELYYLGLLLLWDPAYPLLPHVIKESATCTTDAQVIFNQMLRDARKAIKCAYGRLKVRWPIL